MDSFPSSQLFPLDRIGNTVYFIGVTAVETLHATSLRVVLVVFDGGLLRRTVCLTFFYRPGADIASAAESDFIVKPVVNSAE